MESSSVAVVISDVHYSLNTFQLADTAFRMAVDKAADLGVPLIDCGDITNDKAILRAEYVNTLIKTMQYADDKGVRVYCLIGNHSMTHEKADDHSLHFLEPYCTVVSHPCEIDGFRFIPYQNDISKLKEVLASTPAGSRVIMHQGLETSLPGEYIHDKSAIPKDWVKDYRVISGHYHTRQDIKCGRPRKAGIGLFSYVGNPYTLTYAEANDPPKGFQILNTDGSLTFVPTNLRKHIVTENTGPIKNYTPGDLVRMRLSGTRSEMQAIDKDKLRAELLNGADFKLEKTVIETIQPETADLRNKTDAQLMDTFIDALPDGEDHKEALKKLWREVANEA